MCMGLPMVVVNVDGFLARCEALGVTRDVNIMLLGEDSLQAGDNVLVHLGMAVRTLTPEETKDLWDVIGEAERL